MAFANFRGVYIKGCRNAFKNADIADVKSSALFCVPLKMGAGAQSKFLLHTGDLVREGTVLASPADNTSGFIYSPVSGSIESIADGLNALGQPCKIVRIAPAHKNIELFFKPINDLTASNLFGRLVESGSFDNWGDRYPTYFKYTSAEIRNTRTLIVKLFDSDGYCYSNAAIARTKTREVAVGASLFYKISGAKTLCFAVADSADEIIPKLREEMRTSGIIENRIKFVKIRARYPFDEDHLLAKTCDGCTIKITENVWEKGVVIENAQTCLNFFNAVHLNKPTTHGVVTISGGLIKKPLTVNVPCGLPASGLIESNLFKDAKPDAFCLGGALSGFAQCSMDIGVPLSVSSLNVFKPNLCDNNEIDCVNCGKCNNVCPVKLSPVLLDNYALCKDYGRAKRYGVEACINCGACSFVCPSKRFLAQRISGVKRAIQEGRTM